MINLSDQIGNAWKLAVVIIIIAVVIDFLFF